MRNNTGRTAIALGTLAATLALGAGVASAGPIIVGPDGPGTVRILDGTPPAPPHSCSVFGLGYAWGPATVGGSVALGWFLPGTPVVGVCTDGSWHFTAAG